MESINQQSPYLGRRQPDYPALPQLIRVTGATIPGPSGYASSSVSGPSIYLAVVQQLNSTSLMPRDREPCLALDINATGLPAGYYIGRLAGSYHSLPVYEVGGSPVSANYIDTIINYNDTTVNYTDTTINLTNVIWNVTNNSATYYTGGPIIFESPVTLCGWLFWCYTDYTVLSSTLIDWSLPGTPSTGEYVVFRMDASGDFTIASIIPATTVNNQSKYAGDGAGWTGAQIGPMLGPPNNVYGARLVPISSTTPLLTLDAYDFDIPSGANILGIEVTIYYKKTAGTGVINSTVVGLYDGSVFPPTLLCTTKSSATDWPGGGGTLVLGSSSDLWGFSPTPADINSIYFSFGLAATESGIAAVTLGIDSVQISVTYEAAEGGQVIALANVSDFNMILSNENLAGTASRRLALENGTDKTIGPDGIVLGWYDPESGRWKFFRPDDATGGGGTTSTNGSATGVSTASTTSWADVTSCAVTLPVAGTYLINCTCRAHIADNMAGSIISVRLYNVGTSTAYETWDVTETYTAGIAFSGIGCTSPHKIVTTTGASVVVKLQLQHLAIGAITNGGVDTALISYVRLA